MIEFIYISYDKIKRVLPKYTRESKDSININNIRFLSWVLYIAQTGCRCRQLPKEYGKWYIVWQRFHRWVVT